MTFFPSDFGMSKIGNNRGDGGGDEIREPEKVVIFDDKIGKNSVEGVIKKCDANADEKVAGSVTAGFDIFSWFVLS